MDAQTGQQGNGARFTKARSAAPSSFQSMRGVQARHKTRGNKRKKSQHVANGRIRSLHSELLQVEGNRSSCTHVEEQRREADIVVNNPNGSP